MWGRPLLSLVDAYAIDVHNLADTRDWYRNKLCLRESRKRRTEDSGRPFVDLCYQERSGSLSLIETASGGNRQRQHVIFFTKELAKAHAWLTDRGVTVEPVTTDSGGNQLFRLFDVEGNAIEVCVEPS